MMADHEQPKEPEKEMTWAERYPYETTYCYDPEMIGAPKNGHEWVQEKLVKPEGGPND